MSTFFWNNLPRPIFALAPMADVTDVPFRRLFAKYGKPDVTWTEFISADGLFLAPYKGDRGIHIPEYLQEIAVKHGIAPDNPLLKDLIYTEEERPIVAQFFSRSPERMKKAAELAVDLGFDGVDINMGCPVNIITGQGAGSAMIREPKLAREVIRATKEGANGRIPVTVKTRIGYTHNELATWLPEVLAEEPEVVTMHARTRKDMSKVPARWETIQQAVEIRDQINKDILLLGNGDIETISDGLKRIQETGCDGVMIGRGIFGNPWWFKNIEKAREDFKKGIIESAEIYHPEIPLEEKLEVLLEHVRLFEEILGDTKSFNIMKKHFKAYINGFDGAKEMRAMLMECENYASVHKMINDWLKL